MFGCVCLKLQAFMRQLISLQVTMIPDASPWGRHIQGVPNNRNTSAYRVFQRNGD